MSKVSLKEKPVKLSSVLPASPTSAGNFGVLPREIRDKIYGYMFHVIEKVWFPFLFITLRSDSINHACFHAVENLNPSILGASRCVRQEALEILCLEEHFRPCLLWFEDCDLPVEYRPLVDRLMNVNVEEHISSLEANAKVVSLFTGAEVLGKTFTLDIYSVDLARAEIVKPSLLKAVKRLTGFKTITFRIFPDIYYEIDEAKEDSVPYRNSMQWFMHCNEGSSEQ